MANPAAIARTRAQGIWPGATVHGRGKNWIRHRHPFEKDKFILDHHLVPVHYGEHADQEIDTAWEVGGVEDQPWFWKMVKNDFNVFLGPGTMEFDAGQLIRYVHQNGSEITFQAQQLQWTNDIDQIEAIADPQQITHSSLTDGTVEWAGAFGAGLDFKWMIGTSRLSKYLTVDQLTTLGTPSQSIIDGGNPVLRMQFIFQKTSSVEIWVDSIQWDETGNTSGTSNHVEFRQSGEVLWYFSSPLVVDANGNELKAVQRFRVSGPNLIVEVRVPYAWLETAVYPVVIDPTIEQEINAESNDFRWYELAGSFSNTLSPVVGLPDDAVTGPANSGFHFKGISSDLDGVTVTTAYVIMTCVLGSSGTVCRLKVIAVDAQDPPTPTTYNEAENATRTTVWNSWIAGTWVQDNEYNTAEAKDVIQELIDSYDYSSGTESILMYVEDNNSDNVADRYPTGYNDDPTKTAVLHIEYQGDPSVAGGPQDWIPVRR